MTEQTKLQKIPLEVLFGNPEKVAPHISPDGTKLSYIAPVNGVLNVWVQELGKEARLPDGQAKAVTSDTHRGIRMYLWQEDSRHILYVQDKGGDENWRLYQTDTETAETRELTPFENVQIQLLKMDKHLPDDLLIGLNKDNPAIHDVYHVNLKTGELTLREKNPGNVAGWIADSHLNVRLAMAARQDGGQDLLLKTGENTWEPLLSWDIEDSMSSGASHFSQDGTALYLEDSRNANASRLMRMDLQTRSLTAIAEDPEYDVTSLLVHPDTYEVQAVGFLKDKVEWKILDESIREDFDSIQKLDQGEAAILDRDNNDKIWIVGVEKDNGPAAYYLYRRDSKKGEFLFNNRPELTNYTLAPMQPVSFTSRDGLTIHGYLTLPPGSEGKPSSDKPARPAGGATEDKNLPMVLNVHGGPWARDTWGFKPEAQWLANCGYASLQVNYRGSTGYGKKFLNAGDREWAGKMHDDLIDAVNWAVSQGIADPKRVAIYGGSYGGYAALVGVTFTPDVFCCAVDIVGPSSLITLIKTVPPYWSNFLPIMYKRVGHPEQDEEFLKSRSPLYNVDNIKKPLLIVQGENDPRVKKSEADQIAAALKEKGIPHEYMVVPDEGHGFAKPEARLDYYRKAEEFLAKYL